MKRVAIIGTGIAGLGCAHLLHGKFDLTVYERNDYIGGHTNTIQVEENGRSISMDTGFMVFNEINYPNLTRLFRELKVAIKPAPMSFSVQHQPTGLEFSGSSLNHLFAQRRNLFSPRFWKMLGQIKRFNTEAIAALAGSEFKSHSLGDYVRERKYGEDFLNLYLVPMSSAVWSTPPAAMLDFPAFTLLSFFHNHGFLGLNTQHPWLTVVNGARSYVEKLVAPFREKIRLGTGAVCVTRTEEGVQVRDTAGREDFYDKVILAGHADQTLAMLADATPEESRLLGHFKYQRNSALVHTDATVMPKTKRCWSSWNYRMDFTPEGKPAPSTIYWMNSLQGVSQRQNYFISINGENSVDPRKVLRRLEYEHPLFDLPAIKAQQDLPKLNRTEGKVFFCGSYFGHGFHEDGLTSALQASRALTGENLWA